MIQDIKKLTGLQGLANQLNFYANSLGGNVHIKDYHSRFDENHRQTCEDCRSQYLDFCQEQDDDMRSDDEN